jgi:hypothetical protein
MAAWAPANSGVSNAAGSPLVVAWSTAVSTVSTWVPASPSGRLPRTAATAGVTLAAT